MLHKEQEDKIIRNIDNINKLYLIQNLSMSIVYIKNLYKYRTNN